MKIGSINIDKSDIKALLQSLFITMAIILSFYIGKLATAYETVTIMNYLAGHPEYNITIEGVGIKVTHNQQNFIPEYVMINGSMVLTNSSDWGVYNPIV